MLKFRRKLGEYQEIFYMIFVLSMTGMTSVGLNSEDEIYMKVFLVATCFLLLKMAVTNFTIREILVMAAITFVLGRNFLHNGEKTLILTVMGIFGAKNVDLRKVMRWAFWEKALLTVGTFAAVELGLIENVMIRLPKNGELLDIYCYGYYHPNMAFANIFVVLLVGMMGYGKKLTWFAYAVGTIIMLGAYELFVCRTGMMVWCMLLLLVLGFKFFEWIKWEKVYIILLGFTPVAMAGMMILFAKWARENEEFNLLMDKLLTHRIMLINNCWGDEYGLLQGYEVAKPFDSIYFHLIYNYGWVVFGLFVVLYCMAIWYTGWKGHHYGAIGLASMSVYGFMEMLPLSFLWNMPLLYIGFLLFGEVKMPEKTGRPLGDYIKQYRLMKAEGCAYVPEEPGGEPTDVQNEVSETVQ